MGGAQPEAGRVGAGDLNALPLPEVYRALARGGLIRRLLELARDEDLGVAMAPSRPGERGDHGTVNVGDVTTRACVPPDRQGRALLVAREEGVVAGLEAMGDVLGLLAPGVRANARTRDGERVAIGSTLAELEGPLDEILEAERTLLNLIGRLSGIATRTSAFVEALRAAGPTRARLFDTRKTTPGLRMLEKYAVRCGGGHGHRLGLYDAMLMKDNHLAGVSMRDLPGFVRDAAVRARSEGRSLSFVEVEVDSMAQFEALLTLPAGTIDIVLLDNMAPAVMAEASRIRDARAPGLELEASGGVTLDTIASVARSGVDRISVGGLTHHAVSLDVALDVEPTMRGRGA